MTAHASHAVLFDLDGTLVDSVYQHVRIWHDVLAEHGHHVSHSFIHRGIGMSSDRLLSWLLGHEPAQKEKLLAEHDRRFLEVKSTLFPTKGALELLKDLDTREVPYYAVTSAGPEAQKVLFGALGRDVPVADSQANGKPHANTLLAAANMLKLDPLQITMVGDAIWDAEAAHRSGMHFIGLLCGGTSRELLLQARALWVEESPRELIGRL